MKKKIKFDKNKKDNKNNNKNNSNVVLKNSINLYIDKDTNIYNNEKELNNINNNNVKMDSININNNNKNDKIFGVVYKNKKKNTNIINVNVEQKKDIFGIIQNIEYFDEQKYKNDEQKFKNDDNEEEILTTKEIYGIKKRDYKSISTEQLFKDLNKDNISLEKFDNINVINNNIKINKINRNKFVKNTKDIVCMVCYARNKHITKLCPEQICKICYKKGHSTFNCIYKPMICQYCNKDLNPNNHINDNIVLHKDIWDCPKRKYFINSSY